MIMETGEGDRLQRIVTETGFGEQSRRLFTETGYGHRLQRLVTMLVLLRHNTSLLKPSLPVTETGYREDGLKVQGHDDSRSKMK